MSQQDWVGTECEVNYASAHGGLYDQQVVSEAGQVIQKFNNLEKESLQIRV